MCDWVPLLYSRKLMEPCKPTIMDKITIIYKNEMNKIKDDLERPKSVSRAQLLHSRFFSSQVARSCGRNYGSDFFFSSKTQLGVSASVYVEAPLGCPVVPTSFLNPQSVLLSSENTCTLTARRGARPVNTPVTAGEPRAAAP